MQLWILSIHCCALCPSWAQKLYTRLLVLSYKTEWQRSRAEGQGRFLGLLKGQIQPLGLSFHTSPGPEGSLRAVTLLLPAVQRWFRV